MSVPPRFPPPPQLNQTPLSSKRLRTIGTFIIACGIIGACVFYWIKVSSTSPVLDDMSAIGYERAREHQMGVMMGHFGLTMMQWQDGLARPATQALLIAAASGICAAFFFRAAWVIDDDERDRRRNSSG